MTQITNYQTNKEQQRAYARVQASVALKPYTAILFSDVLQDEPDWQWVATAPETEVLRWAEELRDSLRESVGHDDIASERDEDWQ